MRARVPCLTSSLSGMGRPMGIPYHGIVGQSDAQWCCPMGCPYGAASRLVSSDENSAVLLLYPIRLTSFQIWDHPRFRESLSSYIGRGPLNPLTRRETTDELRAAI